MRVTLKHIADDTGLSIATVSRALSRENRNHSTSEEVIYASARKLGYPLITNDGENQQLSIALVMKLFEGEFYSSLINGFYEASENSDSKIVFSNVAKQNDNLVDDIINISKKHSGICLFLPSMTNKDYVKIKEEVGKYPIISLLPSKNPKIDTVCFDSYRGGYMLAKHFEEQGYKKFGYISGPSKRADALFRKNGFLDHIHENDNLELAWSYEGDFRTSSGKVAFDDFKKKGIKDIAIFGGNDYSCFGFMKAALESGYKIPDDFIIAGYDNLSFCEIFTPELTSIATDFHELGKKSIRIIENMITDDSESFGNISMIPVRIKIRNSTNSKN
jgi:DNA-binding LacI/PurR family transcriptional regulator